MSLRIFIVYNKCINEDVLFPNFTKEYIENTFTYYGVNDLFEKSIPQKYNCNNILEYNLKDYDPFLQQRGYAETSAYLHIYNNNIHENLDYVGICQSNMVHTTKYENLNRNTIYTLNSDQSIVNNDQWAELMFPQLRNIDFLLNSYNSFYNTQYHISDLNKLPLSLHQTNIYPIHIFEKLCEWLLVLVNEIYPWSVEPPYETHWGVIGGFTERAISIFNAIEMLEGKKNEPLQISQFYSKENSVAVDSKFLNYFEPNISTKYIDNITQNSDIPDLQFTMFKSLCYPDTNNNNNVYSCERLRNSKGDDGLIFKYKNISKRFGFDIGSEDPRLISIKGKVYVIFTCVFHYQHLNRGIAITNFEEFNPVFLKIRNDHFNSIEKNWAPFVKNDELYFVYNYDPLIILKYDFNSDGFCDVIFKQNNIELPINTNEPNHLRGGCNLIHYKDDLYIGGCHTRILGNHTRLLKDYSQIFDNRAMFYYTHIVLLNVKDWSIVYLSKPIMYNYPQNDLGKLRGTNILYNITKLPYHLDGLWNIQFPCSINKIMDKFVLSTDINCQMTLLFELDVDIPLENLKSYEMGEMQTFTITNDRKLINITVDST